MSAPNQPFSPAPGGTRTMNVTASDTVLAFPNNVGGALPQQFSLLSTGNLVFVRITPASDTTPATAAAEYPINTNYPRTITVNFDGPFNIHAVSTGGAAVLYVTPGAGW